MRLQIARETRTTDGIDQLAELLVDPEKTGVDRIGRLRLLAAWKRYDDAHFLITEVSMKRKARASFVLPARA